MVTPPAVIGGPLLVKIGGRALESPGAAATLAEELVALPGPRLIVHGGGAEVSAWCERLAIEPRFSRGLRVTDAATLEVAVAVLAGLANKRLVATLRAAGLDAVGLSGADGGVLELAAHPDGAGLGAVGMVTGVAPALLETLLDRDSVPVLASIGAHQGGLLNVNADDAAAALAGALHARALLLLSDTPGLKLDGAIVPALDREALEGAVGHPDVRDGMSPKLLAARRALDEGVPRVVIGAWSGLGSLTRLLAGESGTTFTHEASIPSGGTAWQTR